jgi:hypothetical protein
VLGLIAITSPSALVQWHSAVSKYGGGLSSHVALENLVGSVAFDDSSFASQSCQLAPQLSSVQSGLPPDDPV